MYFDNLTEEELRLQAPQDNRTVGEAQTHQAVQPRIELARGQLSVSNVAQGRAGGNALHEEVFAAGDRLS